MCVFIFKTRKTYPCTGINHKLLDAPYFVSIEHNLLSSCFKSEAFGFPPTAELLFSCRFLPLLPATGPLTPIIIKNLSSNETLCRCSGTLWALFCHTPYNQRSPRFEKISFQNKIFGQKFLIFFLLGLLDTPKV